MIILTKTYFQISVALTLFSTFSKCLQLSSSPSMIPYRDGFFLGGAIDSTSATLLPSPFQPETLSVFSDENN